MSNKDCMLIETAIEELQSDGFINSFTEYSFVEYYITTSNVFPIIAYSIGIPLEDGTINYCSLKSASVHPKLWVEKYNIKNYIYFEIEFID